MKSNQLIQRTRFSAASFRFETAAEAAKLPPRFDGETRDFAT